MPPQTAQAAAAEGFPAPSLPIKFDRWLWERDVDNVTAAQVLNVAPMSIGRWRKRFGDPDRRVPPPEKILEIERATDGEVQLLDWFRPCPVAYVDPETPVLDVTAAVDESDLNTAPPAPAAAPRNAGAPR